MLNISIRVNYLFFKKTTKATLFKLISNSNLGCFFINISNLLLMFSKYRFYGLRKSHKNLKLVFVYTISRSLVFWVKEYFSIFLKKNKFKITKESILSFLFFRVNSNLNIITTYSVLLREPVFLIQILTYVFNHVHFFNHMVMLKRSFYFILSLCVNHDILSGFMVKVSGKISVGGNSRSRVFKIKWNLVSKSKIWLSGKLSRNVIRTITGCLGISLFYFY